MLTSFTHTYMDLRSVFLNCKPTLRERSHQYNDKLEQISNIFVMRTLFALLAQYKRSQLLS